MTAPRRATWCAGSPSFQDASVFIYSPSLMDIAVQQKCVSIMHKTGLRNVMVEVVYVECESVTL